MPDLVVWQPCLWEGVGTGWSLRSFPTQDIVEFNDNTHPMITPNQDQALLLGCSQLHGGYYCFFGTIFSANLKFIVEDKEFYALRYAGPCVD